MIVIPAGTATAVSSEGAAAEHCISTEAGAGDWWLPSATFETSSICSVSVALEWKSGLAGTAGATIAKGTASAAVTGSETSESSSNCGSAADKPAVAAAVTGFEATESSSKRGSAVGKPAIFGDSCTKLGETSE
ncbi:hypothetical protein MANES_13G086056v8 [Manihot esculenta]|uniref:Uncharacterized protein n=1 Tax=Manihot esculenta TaxID=3983 RepID=A0ACB7GKC0_MANES|nr:hypothetical protein MANES_13G086056v8 [Manihot esculenta]